MSTFGSANVDRAGAPLTVEEVEIVELAVVIERFAAEAGEARLDGLDVVAQTGARVVELDAVAAHDVGAHLCAEAEPEAPARQFLEFPGHLRRDHRAARKRHRDTGRHLEARGGQRRRGDCRVGSAATLGEEHAVEAGPLGPLGDRAHLAQWIVAGSSHRPACATVISATRVTS